MINKVTKACKEDILPKVNRENTMSMIKKNHVTMTLYWHPNHKNRYLNQSTYQHQKNHLTYSVKNVNPNIIESQNKRSSSKS